MSDESVLAWALRLELQCICTSNNKPKTIMKLIRILTLTLAATALTLTAVSCKEEKGPAGKIGDKIDDAMDARPAEGVRDAVEKVTE